MQAGIPTVIIDGSELFRAGLKHILAKTPFRVRLAKATLSNLSAQRKSKTGEKAVLIVSLGHPASSDLAELSLLKRHNPQIRILVLSNNPTLEECVAVIEAGADAYLQRADLAPPVLVNALHLVHNGQAVIPKEFVRCIKLSASFGSQGCVAKPDATTNGNGKPTGEPQKNLSSSSRLSAREQEILEYLKKGASNKLIARSLQVAEATVKVHVKALLRKIQVSNRTQAAMWAMGNFTNVQHLATASGIRREGGGLSWPSS